jgi:hypothetical protein
MDRRSFLKLSGLLAAALILQIHPDGKVSDGKIAQVSSLEMTGRNAGEKTSTTVKGKMYRGTEDGKIYSSDDQGKTWKMMVNFGPDYSITRVDMDRSQKVVARLQFANHGFKINLLEDGKTWWAF